MTVAALLAVGGGVAWVAGLVRTHRAEVQRYRDEHSEAKIVGKSADEIIAVYGKPYAAERGSDGELAFIMYKQAERGQYYGIELKDGVAVRVSFWFQ